MFKGLDKKETVSENGIFYLCGIFQMQDVVGRELTQKEWTHWTQVLNHELIKRNLMVYQWAKINRPDLVKKDISEEKLSQPPIAGPIKGVVGSVLYTPLETAIICQFYSMEQDNGRRYNINDIFDFVKKTMRELDSMAVPVDKNLNFYEVRKLATDLHKQRVIRRMN